MGMKATAFMLFLVVFVCVKTINAQNGRGNGYGRGPPNYNPNSNRGPLLAIDRGYGDAGFDRPNPNGGYRREPAVDVGYGNPNRGGLISVDTGYGGADRNNRNPNSYGRPGLLDINVPILN